MLPDNLKNVAVTATTVCEAVSNESNWVGSNTNWLRLNETVVDLQLKPRTTTSPTTLSSNEQMTSSSTLNAAPGRGTSAGVTILFTVVAIISFT